MKFNKWTLGLAAVGAVSLTSAARADEAKVSQLQTALSNTTISGYVDVGAQYNLGNQPAFGTTFSGPAGTFGTRDSFSLNDIDVAIDKPEDETPWASGYHIELNTGNNAVGIGGTLGVRQGYVVLRTPAGNGIDWKAGVQDNIIGYEGNTDGANPNYSRSIGYFEEPTTLLGLVGTYKINDIVTVQAGLANALSGSDPITTHVPLSDKTLVGSVALTAPDSWGFVKGGTLNAGVNLNLDKNGVDNYYVGVTVPTPVSALKVGASFDLVSIANSGPGTANPNNDSGWVAGLYATVQASDKLSFNLRGEGYDLKGANSLNPYSPHGDGAGEELTATVAYNLWANVTSRAEIRWDHSDAGQVFGGFSPATAYVNSYIMAVNIIYTF